ncbi:hypothetical protein BDN70DRAFT_801281 [Pholiota conissans]|uniref:Zinc finger PHD-type domain-containing protein n=1 Tax=Pholiota conissans TaxID=109636 RepID=A0A9P6D3Y1_9AGAR|nr:hypothetical protein BDN70DRAFT_801281 [Pholiota conissans]
MSTRSRTRSALSSKVSEVLDVKPTHETRGKTQSDDMDVDSHKGNGKENILSSAAKSSVHPQSGSQRSKVRKTKQESLRSVDCTCTKGDDGSPMVYCSECGIWYHFTCVDLSEPEAEEINVYVCPTCTVTSGRRSASEWNVCFVHLMYRRVLYATFSLDISSFFLVWGETRPKNALYNVACCLRMALTFMSAFRSLIVRPVHYTMRRSGLLCALR